MAHKDGTKLYLYYKDAGDADVTYSFDHVDDNATDQQVKAVADAIITNKNVFEAVPTTKVGAELVTTTVIEVDISD